MKSYRYQKLQEELNSLSEIYSKIHSEWKTSTEDIENLYKIRVNLYVTAALARLYENDFTLKVIREIKPDENPRDLIYTDQELEEFSTHDFKNKVRDLRKLKDICDYLIHERGSKFCDDIILNTSNFKIYYCVSTDMKEEIVFDIEDFIKSLKTLASKSLIERP